MTELKTLKDMSFKSEGGYGDDDFVDVYVLRREAIKWIKHIQSGPEPNRGLLMWISRFFNITEEDLK